MLGWFWVVTWVPCVVIVFASRHDHVVTEVSLMRLERSQQEVGVTTELG